MRRWLNPNDSGIALVAVLLGLALIGAVAATVVGVSVIEYQTSRDYLAATKARLVADAGVAHAVAVVGGPLASRSFDEILVGADGSGTGNGAYCGTAQPSTEITPIGDINSPSYATDVYDGSGGSTPSGAQCMVPGDPTVYDCYDLYLKCQGVDPSNPDYALYCSQFQQDLSYDWECIDDAGDDGLLAGFPELDASEEIAETGLDYHEGDYQVRLVNDIEDPSGSPFVDTNFRIAAIARGRSDGGGEAQVKVILEAPPYPAVVVNGDLLLGAQAHIAGACAGAHANGRMQVGSNVLVDGPISADSVEHWYYDQAQIDKVQQGAPPIDVPRMNPMDYCGDADYILRNGWKINMSATPDSVKLGGGTDWSYQSSANTYKLGGSTSDLGTFCIDGNVSYTASMGTETEPVPITLLAKGTVSLGGKSRIAPAHPDGLLIVAGGDISIGGQAGARYSGVVYTENQCAFGGSATVEALVLCYDAPDSWTPEVQDMLDMNEVGNSTVVTYDCAGPRQRPRVTAWWE